MTPEQAQELLTGLFQPVADLMLVQEWMRGHHPPGYGWSRVCCWCNRRRPPTHRAHVDAGMPIDEAALAPYLDAELAPPIVASAAERLYGPHTCPTNGAELTAYYERKQP